MPKFTMHNAVTERPGYGPMRYLARNRACRGRADEVRVPNQIRKRPPRQAAIRIDHGRQREGHVEQDVDLLLSEGSVGAPSHLGKQHDRDPLRCIADALPRHQAQVHAAGQHK